MPLQARSDSAWFPPPYPCIGCEEHASGRDGARSLLGLTCVKMTALCSPTSSSVSPPEWARTRTFGFSSAILQMTEALAPEAPRLWS